MAQINRDNLLKEIEVAFRVHKAVALIGPRQVGKTTLARSFLKKQKAKEAHFFDLEDPTDFKLFENAKLTLDPLEGLIVLDEIQRATEIFTYLRTKIDKMKKTSKILLLGSSSRELIEKASESLAGRIQYIEVPGLSIVETQKMERLFARGGFPLSFTAKTAEDSFSWRQAYIQSYIERDLRGLGLDLPPHTIRRLLEMLTGYHGQIFNSSDIGRSLGFSHTTARKYLDILINTFLIRELKPWKESIIQRQVKQPKTYFKDIGLVYALMGLRSLEEVRRHPRLGSFWEGFALEEVIKQIRANDHDLYFWSLHQGGELDLFWKKGSKKIGFEFKYTDKPEFTKSMQKAFELLKLDELNLVYPGEKSAKLAEGVNLIPLGAWASE